MADSLARLIVTLEAQTLSYQKGMENANAKLEQFGKKQSSLLSTVEGGFKKFSRTISQLFVGGGVLVGFRSLERELGRVAEKYKDSDPAARAYVQAINNITEAFDRGFLRVLESSAGLLQKFNQYMDPANVNARELEGALANLAITQKQYNDFLATGVSLESSYAKMLKARLDAAKGLVDKLQDPKTEAGYQGDAAESAKKVDTSDSGFYGTLAASNKVLAEWRKKDEEDAKRAAASLAKYNEDLIKTRIENEQDAADQIAQYNSDRVEEFNRNSERAYAEAEQRRVDDEAALSEQLGKDALDTVKKANDQAKAFSDLFVDNLVQAADSGFKGMLQSFIRTLEQMALRAAATHLFDSLFSSAGGSGFISGLASLFGGGRASGGPVTAGVPYMVGERGPELFIPSVSGSITPNGGGRNVTINQNISVGAGASRAEVVAAMTLSKNQAKAEIRDEMRRRR